jgi:hypothetical protein
MNKWIAQVMALPGSPGSTEPLSGWLISADVKKEADHE